MTRTLHPPPRLAPTGVLKALDVIFKTTATKYEQATGKVLQYIESLMPLVLLDSFVCLVPIGQFAAQIEWLGSFERDIATTKCFGRETSVILQP